MSPDRETLLRASIQRSHVAQLFDEPPSLIAAVSIHLYEGWRRGDNLLIAARPQHWNAISVELGERGCPVNDLLAEGRLVALDAATTLQTLMVEGDVQRESFDARVWPLVERLGQQAGIGLTAYGEMVDILVSQGNFAAAGELERLWNEVIARCPFRLMCGYSSAAFGDSRMAGHLRAICCAHAEVIARPTDLLATWLLSDRRSRYHLGPH
jgi:hypothetical protein